MTDSPAAPEPAASDPESTATAAVSADVSADVSAKVTAEVSAETSAAEMSEQKAVRLAKRVRLIASGAEAYPVELPITDTIPAVRERFGELEADATTGVTVGLAGRIVHLRNTGKLCFASVQSGDGSRIRRPVSVYRGSRYRADRSIRSSPTEPSNARRMAKSRRSPAVPRTPFRPARGASRRRG